MHPDVPANEASELPSDTADLASACLEHVKHILQALRCAGATHGSQDVFHLVKNILEHFSVNTLDEDTECLVLPPAFQSVPLEQGFNHNPLDRLLESNGGRLHQEAQIIVGSPRGPGPRRLD